MRYPEDQIKMSRFHFDKVKPGDTLYTTVTHVARSGMSRSIKVFVMENNVPMDRSWAASRLLGDALDEKNGGVKMGGCGMDMGFHLVYSLGRVLFPTFKCTGKETCPANDHSNERWGSVKKKRIVSVYSKSRVHSDPGYSLQQRWI